MSDTMASAVEPRPGEKGTPDQVERLHTQASIFEPPPLRQWQRRLLVLSLCLSLSLGALDITIISTVLPSKAAHLHVTSRENAWIQRAVHRFWHQRLMAADYRL